MSILPNAAIAEEGKPLQHQEMQNVPGNKLMLLLHFIFYPLQISGKGHIIAPKQVHLHTLWRLSVWYAQENYT